MCMGHDCSAPEIKSQDDTSSLKSGNADAVRLTSVLDLFSSYARPVTRRTFEVALVAAVSAESVLVGAVTFDAHHVLPALFGVRDVLLQVLVELLERQLRRPTRRVYQSPATCYTNVLSKKVKVPILDYRA